MMLMKWQKLAIIAALFTVFYSANLPPARSQIIGAGGFLNLEPVGQLLAEKLADDARSVFEHGIAALNKGKLEEAEKAFNESLRLQGKQIASYLGLAEIAGLRNQQEAALKYLQQAEKIAPYNVWVQRAWGRYYFRHGKFAEARMAFEKARRLDTKSVMPVLELGEVYLNGEHDPQKAVALFREASLRDPNHAAPHLALGTALASQGKTPEAEAALQQAVWLAPDNPLPQQALGRLYFSQKQYDKALQRFEAAIAKTPEFFELHLDQGDVFASKGDDKKAVAAYSRALQINPKSGTAYVKIGMIQQKHGNLQQAEKAYLAAIKADPRQLIAYNNLAMIAVERKQNLDQALQWAEKAVELAPKSPDLLDTLGWVYYTRGELDLARATLEKAVSINPNAMLSAAGIYYHLGVVHMKSGNTHQAALALQKALQIDNSFPEANDARQRLMALN